MKKSMKRDEKKKASLIHILDAASVRLRIEGLEGASISKVMKDAGLTRGGVYSHFKNKEELSSAAFEYALRGNRLHWIGWIDSLTF